MSDKIEIEGKVLEALPNAMFKIEIAGGKWYNIFQVWLRQKFYRITAHSD